MNAPARTDRPGGAEGGIGAVQRRGVRL